MRTEIEIESMLGSVMLEDEDEFLSGISFALSWVLEDITTDEFIGTVSDHKMEIENEQ